KAEARQLAITVSRDFEALNAEQNGMAATNDPEEIAQRIAEQDRLYKRVDDGLATLDKLVTGDGPGVMDQFKAQLDEYRRVDAQFRKLKTSRESDIAVTRYLGDGQKQVGRIRDVMRKGIDASDRGKTTQTALLAREVLATFLAVDDGL